MRDAEKPGRLASLASMLFAFAQRARPSRMRHPVTQDVGADFQQAAKSMIA
jgi:hypothetical protein